MKLSSWKLLAIFGLVFLAATAGANNLVLINKDADPGDKLVTVGVTDPEPNHLILNFDLDGFEMKPVNIDGTTYQQIFIDREGVSYEAGKPGLPYITRSVIIPDDAEMSVSIVSSSYREFDDILVTPSKGNCPRTIDPSTVPYQFDAVYQTDSWYPTQLVALGDPYIMRDVRGMTVTVNPIQYNPVSGKLRVYDQIVVELEQSGPGQINVINRQLTNDHISADFTQMYNERFLNGPGDRYQQVGEFGEMLIIADDAFLGAMAPFVEWKNQAGIKTTLVGKGTVGTTSNAIKSYVQSVYNSSNLAYLLLVGDAAQIPTFYYSGGGADPMYALLAGSDSYPDILVGRFSAENVSQVTTQVERSITYERDIIAGDSWVQHGMGVASTQGPGHYGEYDHVHMGYIRDDLLGYGYASVDEYYGYPSISQLTSSFNSGRGIANYVGHGSTTSWSTSGFSVNSVNALTNVNKLPFINSVACVNGNFTSSTCFGEAWLRATHNGEATGAIGAYMSSINQSWNPPMYCQDEAIDLLIADSFRTMGGLWFNASCYMIDVQGSEGIKHYNTWILFGDPSIRVRTKAATALAIEHEDIILPTATSFDVLVPGVTGALCGLSVDGDYLGAAFTNASGEASIPVSDLPADGSITLTVTAYNRVPEIAEIAVGIPAIPNLVVTPESFTIDLPLGESTTDLLSITNDGEEGSVLEFTLRLLPGSLNSWLSVDAVRGQIPSNETTHINVLVNSAGLSTGMYEGSITVDSNAGDIVVPVTLTVGDMAGTTDRDAVLSLQLSPSYPNPFTSSTLISFALPKAAPVKLGVFDMSGRLVRSLVSGDLPAGHHNLSWDGRNDDAEVVPGGVYFYKISTGTQQISQKTMLLR